MWLLIQYSERFGLPIIPPTFNCFAMIILHGFRKIPRHILDKQNIKYAEWHVSMLRSLLTVTVVWPTFENHRLILAETTLVDNPHHPLSLPTSATDVHHIHAFDQALPHLNLPSTVSNRASPYNVAVSTRDIELH